MPGIGHFGVRAWCTVDQEHNEKKLLQKIFNQVIGSKEIFSEDGIDDNIANNLRKQLFGKSGVISKMEKKEALQLEVLNNMSSFIFKDEEESAKGLMEQPELKVYVDELISSSLVVVSNKRDLMPRGMTVHYDQHFPYADANFFLLNAKKENLMSNASLL
ncbi:hypothetical protein FXO37_02658 [Capsicum annuum]|nr:hypothetical protein FXO37_02658 [Capsicum annuum]